MLPNIMEKKTNTKKHKNMKSKILSIGILIITIIAMIVYSCKKEDESNSPPTIQSITSIPNTSSSNRLPAGDQVTISVTATDPDQDNLSYSWEADGGSFIGETDKSSVTWESPIISSDETFKVSVIVSDGEATSTKDISIYVEGVTLCKLKGYAFYASTTIPVSDVQITVNSKSSTTGEDGYYEINDIPVGNQLLTASKEGYDSLTTNIELNSGTNEFNVEMTSASYTHNLFGYITSKTNGSGISDCKISVLNPDGTESQLFAYTSSSGYYQILTVPQGNRTLRLTEKCYFETQIFMANSNYQFDAEFETELTDPRDGKIYDVVEIGGKAWMAENLNYGQRIDGFFNQEDNQNSEKYCYEDIESNCNTYGGLYQWNEMMQYNTTPGIQGICPEGWHLPTDDEWTSLVDYIGGGDIAGGKLKEKGTTHWDSPNTGATNESGFLALPGGECVDFGNFYFLGTHAYFWSSTEYNNPDAWIWTMNYNSLEAFHVYGDEDSGFSVRCVRDY